MTRTEKMESWWKKYYAMMKDGKAHTIFTENSKREEMLFSPTNAFPGSSPLALHQSMFTRGIKMLGNAENKICLSGYGGGFNQGFNNFNNGFGGGFGGGRFSRDQRGSHSGGGGRGGNRGDGRPVVSRNF